MAEAPATENRACPLNATRITGTVKPMSKPYRPWGEPAPTMNRKRVVAWVSGLIAFLLLYTALLVFGGLPPWPVLMWFALSHGFFCWVILKTKPYRGPYTAVIDSDVPGPRG